MTTTYELRVGSSQGYRLASLTGFIEIGGPALDYTLNAGRIGVLRTTVPSTVDPNLFPVDARMSVWRSINGAAARMDGQAVFLARLWEYGTDYTTVTGFHVNQLFARRIVSYGTWDTTNGSIAATAADDLVKLLVRANMGNASMAFRYGDSYHADISAYVAVAANLSQLPTQARTAAWQSLNELIQDIADTSTFNGTYMTTEIVAPTEDTLEVRTYKGQRGTDRGSTSASPLTFSEDRGNLKNARLIVDRTQEVNAALARGAGVGTFVSSASSFDSARINESTMNRHEVLVDMNNTVDTNQLQAASDAAVRAGRPIRTLEAEYTETEHCIRGIDFDFGDIVVVKHRGFTIDMRLDIIHEVLNSRERRSEVKMRAVV